MSTNKDIERLSAIIKILVEEMGTINSRAFHGYGAVQPYYVKSTREMLGYVEHHMDREKSEIENPVKVSRAFKDTEDEKEDG